MGFTAFKVVAVGVMYRMAALPAEIRNQQQAVKHKAHHGFDAGIGVESTVATFVGNDPAPACHCSCD
jgi:hypothetical protein